MKKDVGRTEAGQQYAAAYAAHYTTKDLQEALALYRGVMATHPSTEEAEDSRSQIQNIVNTVVPKEELFEAHVELALARVVPKRPPDAEPDPVTTRASDLPSWQI